MDRWKKNGHKSDWTLVKKKQSLSDKTNIEQSSITEQVRPINRLILNNDNVAQQKRGSVEKTQWWPIELFKNPVDSLKNVCQMCSWLTFTAFMTKQWFHTDWLFWYSCMPAESVSKRPQLSHTQLQFQMRFHKLYGCCFSWILVFLLLNMLLISQVVFLRCTVLTNRSSNFGGNLKFRKTITIFVFVIFKLARPPLLNLILKKLARNLNFQKSVRIWFAEPFWVRISKFHAIPTDTTWNINFQSWRTFLWHPVLVGLIISHACNCGPICLSVTCKFYSSRWYMIT